MPNGGGRDPEELRHIPARLEVFDASAALPLPSM